MGIKILVLVWWLFLAFTKKTKEGQGTGVIWAVRARMTPKSRRRFPGPLAPGVKKGWKKTRKRVKNNLFSTFSTFFNLFSTLFSTFFDPRAERPREPLFDFLGISGPKGSNDSCKGPARLQGKRRPEALSPSPKNRKKCREIGECRQNPNFPIVRLPKRPSETSVCRGVKIAVGQFLPLSCRSITLTTRAF